jgi:hypothetical protein
MVQPGLANHAGPTHAAAAPFESVPIAMHLLADPQEMSDSDPLDAVISGMGCSVQLPPEDDHASSPLLSLPTATHRVVEGHDTQRT